MTKDLSIFETSSDILVVSMLFFNISILLFHYTKALLLNLDQNSKNFLILNNIRILILFNILNFVPMQNIDAAELAQDARTVVPQKDSLDTILDSLAGLTCETQGVGDLLRSEFSHTCVPAPFFTFAIANIISPGLYVDTMLRLKINDHDLFDAEFPGGQCARNNKIDPKDPKLTFALCNNIKLETIRTIAIAKSTFAIAKATVTGKEPWDDITNIWNMHKSDYHTIYKNQKDGDSGYMLDTLPIFWQVVTENDRMCVTTTTIFGNQVAVGCKYIGEPYPYSIYSSFINLSGDHSHKPSNQATDPMSLVNCSMLRSDHPNNNGCYQRAYNNSKTAIVMTAPLIECIKEMTTKLLVSHDVCTVDDMNQVVNVVGKETSALFQFQRKMHKIVTSLLTLYVIFFCVKILLAGNVPSRSEIINFILKMVFVTYFSIGININLNNNSDYNRLDGMTQLALPLLLGGINELASWVINASPSGLCKFEKSDYDNKDAYIALWDSLDCRISHYLGLDMLSTLLVENQYKKHDLKNLDFFSFSVPPYFYLLIPAIISGQITLVGLALAYPLLIISVGAFMVNAIVMCIISIVILAILAPLFVPMCLFKYTHGYFESWVKLLISFLLQPMVITVFMITMFSVYDRGFYGQCKYTSHVLDQSVENIVSNISTMNVKNLLSTDEARKIKIFFIDNDWSKYTDDEARSCQNSLGYMLNSPLATVFSVFKESINTKIEDVNKLVKGKDDTDKLHTLLGVVMESGMFFFSPKVVFEKVKNLVLALITACFTLYLMYHFSAQLAEFAANMVEGVSLSNVTIKPQTIFKTGMSAINAVGQATGTMNQLSSRAGEAMDKISNDGDTTNKTEHSSGKSGDNNEG